MTTRIHRLWQPGNPQTRVFLPNFWMKLVRPGVFEHLPPYILKFIVSPQMTVFDVSEYLNKIYELPVREVRIMNKMGKLIRDLDRYKKPSIMAGIYGRVKDKEPDEKIAYVVMKKDFNFTFPDLYPIREVEEEEKQLKRLQKAAELRNEQRRSNWQTLGVPPWFS